MAARARRCASTTASVSTYATCGSAITAFALPCVFGAVGMPQPRSMNWPIPWPAAHLVARARKCLFSRMTSAENGTTASSFSATSLSTAKLSLPSSR